jgi:hypothetical protein
MPPLFESRGRKEISMIFRASVLLLAALGLALAQNAPASAGAAGMKISDVTDMIRSGLSEDLVIAALRKSKQPFELTPQQMVQLKKDGVSDNIIKVMLDPSAPASGGRGSPVVVMPMGIHTPRASGATPDAGVSEFAIEANANNPDAPHDSGIYLYTENRNGVKQMIPLERASTQGTKTGVLGAALTGGLVKGKTKAIVPGPHASMRTGDPRPVFYFYFEDKSTALGKSGFGAQTVSNPNQFALLKLDAKKDSREAVVGTIGFGSASSGNDQKQMISFKAERIKPGMYRVIPTVDMEPGEYCFASSSAVGAAAAADIFDFGVLPKQ